MRGQLRRVVVASAVSGVVAVGGCKGDSKLAPVELAHNNDYVSVSGTVAETAPGKFVLDYGDGHITVEMDGWGWYPEHHPLLANDQVVVYGYIDSDLYERRTLEASSVYAKKLRTQFYANGSDEEDFPVMAALSERPRVEVRGRVTEVHGGALSLDVGVRNVTVDTSGLAYDPLDREGFQQITVGDRILVSAALSADLFRDGDIVAESITSLGSSTSEG